jgi:phosphohistidine swiveling domain-containing protein
MRVLISGVTSDLGRAFARAALGAGHELTGVGAEQHPDLPPDVAFHAGDAATAESLVAGMDAVVHLAPVEREVPESGGIPALRRLATGAARHGILFVTPIAHGPDAADADRVVRDSGTRHVVARTAPLGGRFLDWQACRTAATLLTAPRDTQWRLLHTDDLVRFLVYAITTDRTRVVTLSAQDVVTAEAAREALRGVSARGIPRWPDMSTSDRKGTARDWGFECGWTTADVVADLARGARGRQLTKDGATEVVTRLPLPAEQPPRRRLPADGTSLASVALPSMAVEFDDRIDSRYPVFSAQQTAELFPGPLTPLSIDVHTAGLRAAGRTLSRLAGLTGPVADEWGSRGHAVFGHRLYAGVSVAAAMPLPGWSTQSVTESHLGPHADADLFPLDPPDVPTGLRGLTTRMGAWSRFSRITRRYRAAVRDFAAAASQEHLDGLESQPDAVLAVRARLLADRLAEGWTLTQVGVLVAHVAARRLRKRAKGDAAALGRGADVADEPTFPAIAGLADLLRADEELRALAEWGDLEAVRQKSPEFASALDEVLTRIGHRGPNETELSARPFAERPDLVFTAALAASRKPKPVPAPAPAEPASAEEAADPASPAWPTAAQPDSAPAERESLGWPADTSPAWPDAAEPEPTSAGSWPGESSADSAVGWPDDDEPAQPAWPAAAKPSPVPRKPTESSFAWPTAEAEPDVPPAAEPEPTPDESVVDSPAPRVKRKFAEKLAIAGRRQRELAVDATIRYTSELRLLVREWGRRQVRAGRLVDVDDAFYLTLDELLAPPPDALKRVERRREDRERLAEVRMPAVVSGSWRPEVVDYPLPEGKQLHGTGVSAGVVEGPVRVLTDRSVAVELGDVVVVRAADVGHVALLGPAAAVVTDLGGPLCRAAVVARELGVPCVTGTRDGSVRLAPGTVVRVDGTTGDVTVLTPAPASVRA